MSADDGGARLLGPADVRSLAQAAGVRPTKSLGQNFVVDANTVRRIADAARLEPDDVVVEVGPGLGSLTLALLPRVARVLAVEVDPVLAALLPHTVAGRAPTLAGRLDVVAGDALRLDALPAEPTAVVANLPYNIAVPVLLGFLERFPSLRHGLVMVQAEVAERLAARAGEPAYGAPSVKAAWWAEVTRAGKVPPAVFWPVPRVDSGLVRVVRRPPPATAADRRIVFAVVDSAFAQRRKTLRSALAAWAGSPAKAERLLVAAGVDPGLRGERLDVAAFARIAEQAASPG